MKKFFAGLGVRLRTWAASRLASLLAEELAQYATMADLEDSQEGFVTESTLEGAIGDQLGGYDLSSQVEDALHKTDLADWLDLASIAEGVAEHLQDGGSELAERVAEEIAKEGYDLAEAVAERVAELLAERLVGKRVR